MDIGTITGLAFAGGIPSAGALVSYGMLRQRVKELESRVGRAEKKADEVGGLASAVEHLTKEFSAGLSHIGEMFSLNNTHVATQLSDIKAELQHVRASKTNGSQPKRLSQ